MAGFLLFGRKLSIHTMLRLFLLRRKPVTLKVDEVSKVDVGRDKITIEFSINYAIPIHNNFNNEAIPLF